MTASDRVMTLIGPDLRPSWNLYWLFMAMLILTDYELSRKYVSIGEMLSGYRFVRRIKNTSTQKSADTRRVMDDICCLEKRANFMGFRHVILNNNDYVQNLVGQYPIVLEPVQPFGLPSPRLAGRESTPYQKFLTPWLLD